MVDYMMHTGNGKCLLFSGFRPGLHFGQEPVHMHAGGFPRLRKLAIAWLFFSSLDFGRNIAKCIA
jgi:hypothetical protein